MIKYKVRWICKGFRQKQDVNYDEIYASVIRASIVKVLLTLVAKYDYEVEQMNVIIAFLKARLSEKVWVQ